MPAKPSNDENRPIKIPEIVAVKGGPFTLGGKHKINLNDFHIGKYPVTNAEYLSFLLDYQSEVVKPGRSNAGENIIYGYRFGLQKEEEKWQVAYGYDRHPIIYVTWYGAREYCNWLYEKTGDQYRLPSEAEWEYAARGGIHQADLTYAGSQKLKEVGWFDQNSHNGTMPVGLKYPNVLGLCDMSGLVYEWCADHWHDDYEGAPTDGSAWVTGDDVTRRVVRGGSWLDIDDFSRLSNRSWVNADNRKYDDIGFRVSRY